MVSSRRSAQTNTSYPGTRTIPYCSNRIVEHHTLRHSHSSRYKIHPICKTRRESSRTTPACFCCPLILHPVVCIISQFIQQLRQALAWVCGAGFSLTTYADFGFIPVVTHASPPIQYTQSALKVLVLPSPISPYP